MKYSHNFVTQILQPSNKIEVYTVYKVYSFYSRPYSLGWRPYFYVRPYSSRQEPFILSRFRTVYFGPSTSHPTCPRLPLIKFSYRNSQKRTYIHLFYVRKMMLIFVLKWRSRPRPSSRYCLIVRKISIFDCAII